MGIHEATTFLAVRTTYLPEASAAIGKRQETGVKHVQNARRCYSIESLAL